MNRAFLLLHEMATWETISPLLYAQLNYYRFIHPDSTNHCKVRFNWKHSTV